MHSHAPQSWHHDHFFLGAAHARNERRTWIVVALTAAMMVGEIVAGLAFGSMALLADGFHMATHAGALAMAALAYLYARRYARDPRFAFGTGKFGDLVAFASALILAFIALGIGAESISRLFSPVEIRFDEAIIVAVLGLAVNLVSAWLLHDSGFAGYGRGHDPHDRAHGSRDHGDQHHHDHHHDHGHSHDHAYPHRAVPPPIARHAHADHNLRGAYLHVLADALTSVLAIAGLVAGRAYGWLWMDAAVGIVGAIVIARWSWGLLASAGSVLLDVVPARDVADAIRGILEAEGDDVADLHVWRVGPGHTAAIVSLVSDRPHSPEHYKEKLAAVAELSHLTVEVNRRTAA